jgi:hypothetical protein
MMNVLQEESKINVKVKSLYVIRQVHLLVTYTKIFHASIILSIYMFYLF